MACLMKLAAREGITAAQFTAIGAFSSAVLGYFDWQTKDYRRNLVDEQVEVASLTGDIAVGDDGTPSLHIHCVLDRRDRNSPRRLSDRRYVRPTLQVVLVESPAHLRKRHDRENGLALIDPQT
jgi:predicted DNA-binding protein with PD1-like motif